MRTVTERRTAGGTGTEMVSVETEHVGLIDELFGKFEKVLFSLNFPGAGESDRMTMTFVFDVIASGGERSSGWCMRAAVCLGRALAAAAAAGKAR
ncbi:hypothetical protein DPX16_3466 [Anabarilius grahami]|uniref:Uncharacterized protein n=1 Tax=Anabarilius grahami TaxID=495550 RepID=A0A3N0XNB8_ANAGA|nr:hypothetical protein DPX16_3466 [Anabarilius grahami]